MHTGQDGLESGRAGASVEAEPRPRAAETTRLYAHDWGAFAAWCRAAGVTPLPAAANTLTSYLASQSNLSPGALARRLSAINDQHRRVGVPLPPAEPERKTLLRAARRSAKPRRDAKPTAAQLTRMAAACPGDLAGLRDRALFLMMRAGLSRQAVTSLQAEHVQPSRAGLDIFDTYEKGPNRRVIALVRQAGEEPCAVRALAEWLQISQTSFGPVFRKIDRWGNLEYRCLGADAVRRILARRTPRPTRSARGAPAT